MATRIEFLKPPSRIGMRVAVLAVSNALVLSAIAFAQSFTVSGTVQDSDGTPIPGATVRLFEQTSNYAFPARMESMARQEVQKSLRSVRTGQDGGYQIGVPALGFWWLELNATGKAAVSHVLDQSDGDHTLGPIKLPAGQRVDLRLADEKGKPVAGALVRVSVGRNYREPGSASPISQAARSDENGVATLWLASGRAQVDVVAEGFVPGANRGVPWEDLTGGDWSEITLLRAPEQVVRVLLAGQPLADAVVFLDGGRLAVGRTDAAGEVLIPVPPMATKANMMPMVVESEKVHHHFGLVSAESELDPEALDAEAENSALPPEVVVKIKTQTVSGRVVDRAGQAVAGVQVWTTSPRTVPVVTDRAGRYQLELDSQMPNSTHQTHVQAAGSGFTRTRVELGDHRLITMKGVRELLVTVRDENGEPVEGVELSLVAEGRVGNQDRRSVYLNAVTGEMGVARLRPLKLGVQYQFDAYRPGFRHKTASIAAASTTAEVVREFEVVLEPGATHTGWVVDEFDEPVVGAMVVLEDAAAEQRMGRRSSSQPEDPLLVVFSDSEGRFTVADVEAERVNVKVQARGFAPLTVIGVSLPRQASEIGTMILVPGQVLSGRVVDESEQPLEGLNLVLREVRVFLGPRSREEVQTNSAEDGVFTFDDLAQGTYVVTTMSSDHESVSEQVELPQEKPLLIQLGIGRSLKLRITDEQNELVARPRVAQFTANGSNSYTWNAGEGELRGMLADRFQLQIWDARAGSNEFHVQLGAGQEVAVNAPGVRWDGTTLHVVLVRGAGLEGTVTDSQGNPVVRASVVVNGQASQMGSTWVQVQDGQYELYGLQPGQAEVFVSASGYSTHQAAIEIEANGPSTYDVVMEEGWNVAGVIRGPEGEAVSGALVHLSALQERRFGGSPRATTDEEGAFRLKNVASGSYRLGAQKAGFSSAKSDSFFEVGGPVQGLELILSRGTRVFGRLVGAPADIVDGLQVMAQVDGESFSTSVAFDGSYEFFGVPKGTVQLYLVGTGVTAPRQKTVRVSGEQDVEVDFVFGDFRLTGTLLRNGEALVGASVVVLDSEMSLAASGTSDEFGNFVVEGLDPGEVTVMVSRGSNKVHQQTIVLDGDQDLMIEIATVELRGRVTNPTGEPVPNATVVLQSGDEAAGFLTGGAYGRTDAQGEFVLELPAPVQGGFTVKTQAEGFSSRVSQWNAGDPRFLELQLGEGLPLDVRWLRGRPDYARISFVHEDGRVAHQSVVMSGRSTIQDAPPGTWTVYAMVDYVVLAAQVTLRAPAPGGPPNVVEFNWPSTGRLHIQENAEELVQGRRTLKLRLQDASGGLVSWPVGGILSDFLPTTSSQASRIPVGRWDVEIRTSDGEEVLFAGPVDIQTGVTTKLDIQ